MSATYPTARRSSVSLICRGGTQLLTSPLACLLAGLILPLSLPNPWWGLLLIAVACAVFRRKILAARGLWHAAMALCVGSAVTGVQGAWWWGSQLPEACWRLGHGATLQIVSFPTLDWLPDGTPQQWFLAEIVDSAEPLCHVSGAIGLSLYMAEPALRLGDTLQAVVKLRPPATQLARGVVADQARNIARNRRANGTIVELMDFERAAQGILAWRRALAAAIDDALATAQRGPESAAIVRALVVGDASGISRSNWQTFRRLGIAHVLVISGLHIGLVAGFVWGAVGAVRRLIRMPDDRGAEWSPIFSSLLAATVYSLLAGLTLPTQRALVMVVLALLLRGLGWQTQPMRGLLLAIAMILLVHAHSALGSSLWMSAGATAVLLWLARNPRGDMPWLMQLLWLQIRLVLWMVPLGWFWFGEVSLIGVISNLTFVPVLSWWTVPMALVGAIADSLSPGLGDVCWRLAALPMPALLSGMTWLEANADWGVVRWQVDLLTAGALALSVIALRAKRVAVLIATWLIWWLLDQPPETELTVLDVGQGSAVVFRHEDKTLLYDTGGGMPGLSLQADKIILPWLAAHHIRKIDTLVVSHQDLDHSAGAMRLREALAPNRIIGWGGAPCRVGDTWEWRPHIRFVVLNGDGHSVDSSNANSCVLLIEAKGSRILLAGDIDVRRERALVRYWRDILKCDVLLLAHHGSNTSTGYTWLKWTDPDEVVISRSRANRFGHPAAQVMARLEAMGPLILDTAESGTIGWRLLAGGVRVRSAARSAWSPYWLALR